MNGDSIESTDHWTIVWHPGRMAGEPTIGETRLTVEWVAGRIAAGEPVEEVAADYDITVRAAQTACWWMTEHAPPAWHRQRWHRQIRRQWHDWATAWRTDNTTIGPPPLTKTERSPGPRPRRKWGQTADIIEKGGKAPQGAPERPQSQATPPKRRH